MGGLQSSARFEDVGSYTPERSPLKIYLLKLALSNVYLCDGILIDSGTIMDFRHIKNAVEDFQSQGTQNGTLPLMAHALTHAHPDHQGSSNKVCNHFGVPYFCHENDKAVAEGRQRMSVGPPYHPMNYLPHNIWSGGPHPVDRDLKQGDRIGASQRIEVIETPGHTPGSISFWIPDSRVVIVGDVLANQPFGSLLGMAHVGNDSSSPSYPICPREPPRRFSQNCALNRESLRKILSLGPSIICFGHGPPLVLLNGPLMIGEEKTGVVVAAGVGAAQ